MKEFLGDLLLFVALGQFLDQVVIGRNQKEALRKYLERQVAPAGFHEKYVRFLAVAREVIFGRFFSSNFLSPRFFLSAASVSLTSFFLIAVVQSLLLNDGLLYLSWSAIQLMVILAFVLFNILLDYLTIAQTKAFVDAAIEAKSSFRSSLFVVSDILVTINVFILLFSAFVLAFSQFFLAPSVDANISLALRDSPVTIEYDGTDAELARQSGYSAILPNVPTDEWPVYFIVSAGSQIDAFRLEYSSTYEAQSTSLLALLLNITTVTVSPDEVEILDVDEFRERYKSLQTSALSSLLVDQELSDEFVVLSVDASLTGALTSFTDLNRDYTTAFVSVDELEDSFPAVLFVEAGWEPIGSILSRLNRSYYEVRGRALAVCEVGEELAEAFFIEESEIETGAAINIFEGIDCSNVALFEASELASLQVAFGMLGRDNDNVKIPYNAMFITSLAPTVFFYLSIISLSFTVFTYTVVFRNLSRGRDVLLRAPLTIPITLLGGIAIFIGVW